MGTPPGGTLRLPILVQICLQLYDILLFSRTSGRVRIAEMVWDITTNYCVGRGGEFGPTCVPSRVSNIQYIALKHRRGHKINQNQWILTEK